MTVVSRIARDARGLFRWNLAIYWVLLYPMLFFAVMSTFSFVDLSANTGAAGAYGSASQADSASVLHSILSILAYFIIVVVMLRSYRKMIRVCADNLIAFALPTLAFLSIIWSQFPSRSFLYAGFILLNTLFGLYLAARFRPLQQINLIALTGVVATISSFVLAIAYPAAGVDYKEEVGGWQGIFPHKNVAGLLLILFVLPVFCVRLPISWQKSFRWVYTLLAMIFVIMTQSRTAWIIGFLLVGNVMLMPYIRRLPGRERILASIVTVFGSLFIAILAYAYQGEILIGLGKDPTLTGRTIIWGAAITAALKRPFLGFGYFAFWNGLRGESINVAIAAGDLSLGNAENGVLQLWLELGLVGVFLLGLSLFRTCRNALILLRSNTERYVDCYFMILVFTLLSLVDGMKLFYPHLWPWIFYVMADAAMAAEVLQIRSTAQDLSQSILDATMSPRIIGLPGKTARGG